MIDTPTALPLAAPPDITAVWAMARTALDMSNDNARRQAVMEDRANKSDVRNAVIDAKLDAHLVWCVQSRAEDRDADRTWRESLGRRLDEQDKLQASRWWKTSGAVIALLLAIISILLTHGHDVLRFG